MPRPHDAPPPVTEAHLRAAFAAMAWLGWSYEQAMADTVRSRLVTARAYQLRNTEWRTLLRRPLGVLVTTYTAPHRPAAFDCKRAAAGDRDD